MTTPPTKVGLAYYANYLKFYKKDNIVWFEQIGTQNGTNMNRAPRGQAEWDHINQTVTRDSNLPFNSHDNSSMLTLLSTCWNLIGWWQPCFFSPPKVIRSHQKSTYRFAQWCSRSNFWFLRNRCPTQQLAPPNTDGHTPNFAYVPRNFSCKLWSLWNLWSELWLFE